MSTPTEPGYYWWTPPRGKPRIAEAVRAHGMLMADIEPGTPWFTLLEAVKGEWGPRIPAPDRLRAMEEVMAKDITAYADPEAAYCPFCEVEWDWVNGDKWTCQHLPTCPWLRAQETPR